MVWAAIGSTVAGAVVSSVLAPSPGSSMSPTGAAAASDPFAPQRPQYQIQLQNLMTGGFTPQDPSYSWRFNQGLTALERTMASSGRMGSGAELAAATEYGQDMASQEYSNQFARLSQLAGANVGSPAAAGQILAGAGQQQQAGATAVGNAVASGVSNWLNPTPAPAPAPAAAPADTSSWFNPSPAAIPFMQNSGGSGSFWGA